VDLASLSGGAWNFGSSIMTFAFPGGLFIVVALALWVAYTKPETVPGHWIQGERPVSYTLVPRPSQAVAAPAATAPSATASPAAAAPPDTTPADASPPDVAPASGEESGAAGSEDGA
jgi:hypothetical protein